MNFFCPSSSSLITISVGVASAKVSLQSGLSAGFYGILMNKLFEKKDKHPDFERDIVTEFVNRSVCSNMEYPIKYKLSYFIFSLKKRKTVIIVKNRNSPLGGLFERGAYFAKLILPLGA